MTVVGNSALEDRPKGPALVILDPTLTADTPEFIWLSTGVRAIDHCVEIMCSLSATEKSDQDASSGLRLLVPGLLRCKRAADQGGGGSKRDADGNEREDAMYAWRCRCDERDSSAWHPDWC